MSEGSFVRFTRYARAEHGFVLFLFVLLCLTGFPQTFHESPLSTAVVGLFGGIDTTRWLHRAAGLAFAGFAVVHLATALLRARAPDAGLSLVPGMKDVRDALVTLRHELGVSEEKAAFDRFDYRQKFEYWGMLLGGALMIGTGLVLYAPLLATRVLPGAVIPAAKAAHGSEGFMAFLVVIVWHLVHAHFEPGIFPADRSIFTGRIALHRMEAEHPLELQRARGMDVPPAGPPATLANLALAPAKAAAFVMFLPAAGLVVLAEQGLSAWRRRTAARATPGAAGRPRREGSA